MREYLAQSKAVYKVTQDILKDEFYILKVFWEALNGCACKTGGSNKPTDDNTQ